MAWSFKLLLKIYLLQLQLSCRLNYSCASSSWLVLLVNKVHPVVKKTKKNTWEKETEYSVCKGKFASCFFQRGLLCNFTVSFTPIMLFCNTLLSSSYTENLQFILESLLLAMYINCICNLQDLEVSSPFFCLGCLPWKASSPTA